MLAASGLSFVACYDLYGLGLLRRHLIDRIFADIVSWRVIVERIPIEERNYWLSKKSTLPFVEYWKHLSHISISRQITGRYVN